MSLGGHKQGHTQGPLKPNSLSWGGGASIPSLACRTGCRGPESGERALRFEGLLGGDTGTVLKCR